MLNDFFAPFVGVGAVVAHARVVVHHGAVEVVQEQVGGDGVGQRGAVVALVLVIPVAHGVVIGIRKRDFVDALIHLHILVRVGADGREVVFHGEIHIGGAHALVRLLGKTAHYHILPLAGEPSAAAELGKFKRIGAVVERLYFFVQFFLGGLPQGRIIVAQAEIHLVDNFQQIDFKLHGREQRTAHHDLQLAAVGAAHGHIVADGVPQAEELHIVVLDKADGAQVVKLFVREAQRAEVVDLRVDLVLHLGGEYDVLVAALEIIFAAQVGVLVKNNLIHVEFIEVGIQQGYHNRL